MSFLDKFKGKGRDADRHDDDLASMFDEIVPVQPNDMVLAGAGAGAGGRSSTLTVDLTAPTLSPVPTQNAADSSLMSETGGGETVGESTARRACPKPAPARAPACR
jgi:hypothetical protein